MKKRKIQERHIRRFEERLRQEEKSKNTMQKYRHDLLQFVSFLRGRTVEKTIVLDYKEFLGQKYELAGANSMIAAVNRFLRFMSWEDCCIKPFKIQKKTFCSEERELTKEEYIRLVKTAEQTGKKQLSLILQTVCGTGIRIGELQYITVEAAQKGEAVVSCKNKSRTVFIVRDLRKRLLQYCKQRGIVKGSVFVTKTGNPVNRCNVWREMKGLCEQSHVPKTKVFPHNLRHLFARIFYTMEKDVLKLADILGHSNINTTRIYTVTTGAEHRRKMEQMHLII